MMRAVEGEMAEGGEAGQPALVDAPRPQASGGGGGAMEGGAEGASSAGDVRMAEGPAGDGSARPYF